MNMSMNLNVLGITRFRADDGSEYSTLFHTGDTEVTNERLGAIPQEAKADFQLLEKCKEFSFPAVFECEAKLVSGSKKKTTVLITSMKPLKGSSTTASPNPSATK